MDQRASTVLRKIRTKTTGFQIDAMKHIHAISLILMMFTAGIVSETWCSAQSDMIWRVGGQFGVFGNTFCKKGSAENFTMSATLGFDIAIKDTPWRCGAEVGLMNQGIAHYSYVEDEPDRFVRPNFGYAGAFAEYGFSAGKLPLFCRAGLAYAQQHDAWIYHVERKHIPLVITGFGFDWNYLKITLNGYIAPEGNYVLTVSGGLYFGKRKKPI